MSLTQKPATNLIIGKLPAPGQYGMSFDNSRTSIYPPNPTTQSRHLYLSR